MKIESYVKNKGKEPSSKDFCVIGKIVENGMNIEYLVLNNSTLELKKLTEQELIWVLESNEYTFNNVEVNKGKLECTECSIERLPKYDKNLNTLDASIFIYGKIYSDKDETLGYRIITNKGKMADVTENQLISLTMEGIKLANAKVVNRKSGSSYISAIKQEFNKIVLDNIPNIAESKIKIDAQPEYQDDGRPAGKVYRDNFKILRILNDNISSADFHHWYGDWRKIEERKQDYLKKVETLIKYVLDIKYSCNIPDDVKKLVVKIMDAYKTGKLDFTWRFKNYAVPSERLLYNLMKQTCVNKIDVVDLNVDGLKRIIEDKRKEGRNVYYSNRRLVYYCDIYCNCAIYLTEFDKLGLLGEELKNEKDRLLKHLKEEFKVTEKDLEKKFMKRELLGVRYIDASEFDLEFKNTETIRKLGFSLSSKSNRGYVENKKLVRYLVDFVPNFDQYRKMSTCLGDLLWIAKTEHELKVINTGENRWKYADIDRCKPLPEMSISRVKVLSEKTKSDIAKHIVMLYYNNPKLAKLYIDLLSTYQYNGSNFPIYDIVDLDKLEKLYQSKLKGNFSLGLDVYCKSGGCILLCDDNKVVNLREKSIAAYTSCDSDEYITDIIFQDIPGRTNEDISKIIKMIGLFSYVRNPDIEEFDDQTI